jgi:hypothetical protein
MVRLVVLGTATSIVDLSYPETKKLIAGVVGLDGLGYISKYLVMVWHAWNVG